MRSFLSPTAKCPSQEEGEGPSRRGHLPLQRQELAGAPWAPQHPASTWGPPLMQQPEQPEQCSPDLQPGPLPWHRGTRKRRQPTALPETPSHVASEDHFLLPHASNEDGRTCSNSFLDLLGSPDKLVGEMHWKTVIILCNSQICQEFTGARHFICTASHFILTTRALCACTDKGTWYQRGNVTCPEPYSSGAVCPGVGNGDPLQYSCLENYKDKRRWLGYSPRSCKELDMTEQLSMHTAI